VNGFNTNPNSEEETMQNFDENRINYDIPEGMRPHVPVNNWANADKSWLKARGRSVRMMLDSVDRGSDTGSSRLRASGIAAAVVAGLVGISSVFAGPSATGSVAAASLNPLAPAGFIIDQLTGATSAPAAASLLEDCGPVAADAAVSADTNAQANGTVEPEVSVSLPPIPPGGIPLDVPSTFTDPTVDGGPTDDPTPPTEPPVSEPPAAAFDGNLIGADVNLLGQDVANVGILNGGLLGVGVDSLDPNGSGTSTGIGVTDGNGNSLVAVTADPQSDGIVHTSVNGNDSLAGLTSSDPVGSLTGSNPVSDLTDSVLGTDPLGGVTDTVGGVTDGVLGTNPLGGLLN
jgi:hypothetical protein